jgi:hypothetical protein
MADYSNIIIDPFAALCIHVYHHYPVWVPRQVGNKLPVSLKAREQVAITLRLSS